MSRASCPSCCCPELSLNSSGGDEGYDKTYSHILTSSYTFFVTFTAYSIPDEMSLFADNSEIYNTGCIGLDVGQPSSVSAFVTMPENTSNFRIRVNPNCSGPTSGTLWTLFASNLCLDQ